MVYQARKNAEQIVLLDFLRGRDSAGSGARGHVFAEQKQFKHTNVFHM